MVRFAYTMMLHAYALMFQVLLAIHAQLRHECSLFNGLHAEVVARVLYAMQPQELPSLFFSRLFRPSILLDTLVVLAQILQVMPP